MFTEFQLHIVAVLLCIIILLQIALYAQRARAARRLREGADSPPSSSRKPAKKPRAAFATAGEELPLAVRRHNSRCRRAAGGAMRVVGTAIATVTRKKKQEEPEDEPPVELVLHESATSGADQTRLLVARHSPGFNPARRLVEQALLRHSTTVNLDRHDQSVAVRYLVDGVWHTGDTAEFEPATAAVDTLTTLSGLDASGTGPGSGEFTAVYNEQSYDATVTSRATRSGRRVAVDFDLPQEPLVSFADIGVSPRIEAELRAVLDKGQGFFLLSAAPDAGLRTTTGVLLHGMDRLQRDAISIEDQHTRYPAIEAVDLRTYCSASGQCPADLLPEVFHRDPHVIVVRDLRNGRTVDALCGGLGAGDRLVIGTVRAGGCVEALLRVLRLGADRAAFAHHVTAVLNQRLIRKLCNACKQPYTPKPEALGEFGVAGKRAGPFFRRPPKSDTTCPECGGIGYRGRTGLFELLLVGNRVREQLVVSPKSDLLAGAAAEDGMRSLREEGARLVTDGVTSVTELARVLKRFPLAEPAGEITVLG